MALFLGVIQTPAPPELTNSIYINILLQQMNQVITADSEDIYTSLN
jgi:hypothetical protein